MDTVAKIIADAVIIACHGNAGGVRATNLESDTVNSKRTT
jgi:hypothetical protein